MIRRETFLKELSVAVPESGAVVIEHMADNDGLLLHLLMGDLVRMTVSSYAAGEVAVTHRLLAFIDTCLAAPAAKARLFEKRLKWMEDDDA